MNSRSAHEWDSQILNSALEAGLIRAIDFAELASQMAQIELPADDLLVQSGLISEPQRQGLVRMLQDAVLSNSPDDPTYVSRRSGTGTHENPLNASVRKAGGDSPPSGPAEAHAPVVASTPPSPAEGAASRSPSSPQPGNSQTMRYTWERRFAQGGLGAVWVGVDERLDRRVALKEILPASRGSSAAVARFLDEAQITAQLEHPGIVPVYDLGYKPNGSPFYAMKYVEGQTLGDAIRDYHRSARPNHERIVVLHKLLRVYVDVCQTMGFAHDRGIIHRDLKPSNVIMGRYGETLVVDWGLAKSMGKTRVTEADNADRIASVRPLPNHRSSEDDHHTRTQVGQVLGTPSYLSPEQALGQIKQLDARSDIFSLGVILYELLVGRTPHAGRDAETTIRLVSRGEQPTPRQATRSVPKPLNAICAKATAFHPKDRYLTALELADDINQWLVGEPVTAYHESLMERGQRAMRRHRSLVTSTGSILFLWSVTHGSSNLVVRQAYPPPTQVRHATEVAPDRVRDPSHLDRSTHTDSSGIYARLPVNHLSRQFEESTDR